MSFSPLSHYEKVVYAYAGSAWAWMEVNGWYALGGLVVFLFVWPYVAAVLKSMRAKAYRPSAGQVTDFQERQRAARQRQEESARLAAEGKAVYEQENRVRLAEERAAEVEEKAKSLGLRPRFGGRRLGTGAEGEEEEAEAAPKPRPKPADDPFRRRLDRNPLAGDSGGSRGYAPARRQVNSGGGG
mmetsp:Transcript_27818/g.68393  ORF Transcript_27818/g.68393 Transcript_27818/m.68393 type:complete len:185 (-) Transcript_27818:1161-1715(-)